MNHPYNVFGAIGANRKLRITMYDDPIIYIFEYIFSFKLEFLGIFIIINLLLIKNLPKFFSSNFYTQLDI